MITRLSTVPSAIREIEEDGSLLTQVTYQASSLEDVDLLLKCAVHMHQVRNRLPGPLRTVRMTHSGGSRYQMMFVFEKITEWNSEFFQDMQLEEEFPLSQKIKLIYSYNEREVYEACTGLPQRLVVVKVYHCGPMTVNDFIQEALLQAKVESRYTCRILSIGLSKGTISRFQLKLVMERLSGDLAGDIQRRKAECKPYAEAELRQILGEVADALVYAKSQVRTSQGVAHRDIKPANIFLHNGHCKLGDFGSAADTDQKDEMKADLTFSYSSPEMRKKSLGEGISVDLFQNDVYTLGVSVLHLAKLTLSGNLACAWKEEASKFDAVVEAETKDLAYSSELRDLLNRMMRKDPQLRPAIECIRLECLPSEHSLSPEVDLRLSSQADMDKSSLLSVAVEAIKQGQYQDGERILLNLLSATKLSTHRDYMLPEITHSFALLYLMQGRFSEGRALLQSLASAHISRTDISDYGVQVRIMQVHLYFHEGKLSEAIEMLEEDIAKQHGEEHLGIAEMYSLLGALCNLQGRTTEAEKALERSLSLLLKLKGENSLETMTVMTRMGTFYMFSGKLQQAEITLRQCINIAAQLFGTDHQFFAMPCCILAADYMVARQVDAAEELLNYSLEVLRKTVGEEDPMVAACNVSLGTCQWMKGNFSEGSLIFQQGFQLLTKLFGGNDICSQLCRLFSFTGPPETATPSDVGNMFARVCQQLSQWQGEGSPLSVAFSCFASIFTPPTEISSQMQVMEEVSFAYFTHLPVPEIHISLMTLKYTISINVCHGQIREAEERAAQALGIACAMYGEEHLHVLFTKNQLAAVYLLNKKFSQAEAILLDVLDRQESQWQIVPIMARLNLGLLYKAIGELYAAATLLEEQYLRLSQQLGTDNIIVWEISRHLQETINSLK